MTTTATIKIHRREVEPETVGTYSTVDEAITALHATLKSLGYPKGEQWLEDVRADITNHTDGTMRLLDYPTFYGHVGITTDES